MKRRDFLKLTGLSALAAIIPFSFKKQPKVINHNFNDHFIFATRTLEPGTYMVQVTYTMSANKHRIQFRQGSCYTKYFGKTWSRCDGETITERWYFGVEETSEHEFIMITQNMNYTHYHNIQVDKINNG